MKILSIFFLVCILTLSNLNAQSKNNYSTVTFNSNYNVTSQLTQTRQHYYQCFFDIKKQSIQIQLGSHIYLHDVTQRRIHGNTVEYICSSGIIFYVKFKNEKIIRIDQLSGFGNLTTYYYL